MSQNSKLPSSEIKSYVKKLYGEILLEMDAFLDKRDNFSLKEKQKLSSFKNNFIKSSSELKKNSSLSSFNKRSSPLDGMNSFRYSQRKNLSTSYFSPYVWEKEKKDSIDDQKQKQANGSYPNKLSSFLSLKIEEKEELASSITHLEKEDLLKNDIKENIEDLMLSLATKDGFKEDKVLNENNFEIYNSEDASKLDPQNEEKTFILSSSLEEDPFFESLEETFSSEEKVNLEKEFNVEIQKDKEAPLEVKEETLKIEGMPFGLFSTLNNTSSLFWAGEIKWYLIKKQDKESFKENLPKDYALCDGEVISQTKGRLSASPEKIEGTLPSWIEQYDEDHIVVAVVHLKKQEFSF